MDVPVVDGGAIATRTVPLLTALNLDLRNEYVLDCARGLRKWNAELEQAGLEQRLTLPHAGFNRRVGAFAGHPSARPARCWTPAEWDAAVGGWLPTPTRTASGSRR